VTLSARWLVLGRTPEHLARVCWFLALLTEAYRGGSAVAMAGPLGRFGNRQSSVDEVLRGGDQPARQPPPRIRGSAGASAREPTGPLVPWAGVLRLGTAESRCRSDRGRTPHRLEDHLSQAFARHPGDIPLIGYALLDFDDAYQLTEVGIFSARYA
jgi:hypothetical protein